jgi:hypothetical protein
MAWGTAPPGRAQIEAIFAGHPGAGVGVALGPGPDVVDFEIDDPSRAGGLLARLSLPDTLGWQSARGSHRLFRWDVRLASLVDVAVVRFATDGSELRLGGPGKQTMSVCPPTVGVNNRRRRKWNGVWEVAALPESLLRALERPRRQDRRPAERPGGCRYAAAALRYETRAVAEAPQGTRNVRLNRAAFCLGTLVGAGHLPRGDVESALTCAALTSGLPAGEVAATLRSGLEAGIARPRG